MTSKELKEIRLNWLNKNVPYRMVHHSQFNYRILSNIMYIRRAGRGDNDKYNDVIIMADTETSKKTLTGIYDNHVCAWTISIRAFNRNIATLYGHKPSTMIESIDKIHHSMQGEKTIIYFHNMAYDYVFLRKFMFNKWMYPEKQLNTKPHYPIFIEFGNGLIFKDSLILAQRKLEKWADDLEVEHRKAVGKWDYDKLRNQEEVFTAEELEYIEHDTLAGVECIQKMKDTLNKRIYSMPYTATGIPREESRTRGKDFNAHDAFTRSALTYEQHLIAEQVYHGGYTHANRHFIEDVQKGSIVCYDFASSYPYCLLTTKMPAEKFTFLNENISIEFILNNSEEYAYMFKLILVKPRLKNDFISMPALQLSKCTKTINAVTDNGRILCAEYAEIYLNEIDLKIIAEQYDFDSHICSEVMYSLKEFLPRWFTDYIFELFEQKTKLKGGDPVLYALAKAKLNSLYGMCVQKPIREDIQEDYATGEYTIVHEELEELYDKYLKKHNTILPYYWGIWTTSAAFYNLFQLGKCCKTWLYSDTDSCYGMNWNQKLIDRYNKSCKKKLKENGYGCVLHNDREYWLGVAEKDAEYSEFVTVGAKRYCGRSLKDNELHITVAGVPKNGYKCLNNDINNFKPGLIFPGTVTGKRTHTYLYVNEIYTDKNGNETGDSIDLSSCDYLLDSVNSVDWEKIYEEEINIQVYDED